MAVDTKALFDAVRRIKGAPLTQTDVNAVNAAIGAQPVPQAPAAKRKKTLVAMIGTTAAALIVPLVMQWEGRSQTAYRDIVGVWTICDGDTQDVKPGQVASKAECDARLERQLIAHAEPVLACTPNLKDRPYLLASAASLAYNIGPTAYCKSTVDRRFDAGDFKGGCDAFLAFRFAGGKEVQGLLNRRRAEREICLKGA